MKGKPNIVRAVLLERHVLEPGTLFVYGRALWADTRRADFKGWVSGPALERIPPGVRSQNRTLQAVRDPLLAQEWAWIQWDDYRADLLVAMGAAAQ